MNVAGGYSAEQVSRLSEPPQGTAAAKTYQNYSAGFPLSWEIDLFGRLRREKEAAFAAYLATEQGQRAALVTLVADVASTYLFLRQLDLQLEIARRTVGTNDETVRFYEARLKGGVSNRLEVDQALGNRARTATVIPQTRAADRDHGERALAPARPAPGPDRAQRRALGRRRAAGGSRRPAGLAPREAAGRARGRAAPGRGQRQRGRGQGPLLPHHLAHGPSGHDQRRLLEPPEGRLQRLAGDPEPLHADLPGREDQAQLRGLEGPLRAGPGPYQKAALNGYREVADALVGVQKLGEARLELEDGVDALRDASQLARSRYDNGLSNYLEILIADQYLFDQELALAQVRGDEMRAFVELYRALGGGWQVEPGTRTHVGHP